MKEVNELQIYNNKILINPHQGNQLKCSVKINFQLQKQVNISRDLKQSLLTNINKSQKSSLNPVPKPLRIKYHKKITKDCIRTRFNHFKLPQMPKPLFTVYQSHSKSRFKIKDLSLIKQRVNQSYLKINLNNNYETNGTTSAEEKNSKLNKLSILYEVYIYIYFLIH